MGTSNWQNISYNIELVKKLNPKSILDIGVGFGRWGILFREFLEIWGDGNHSGKWKRIIDGVEIFPDYIKPYHGFFYDNIFIGDALDFVKKMKRNYDLINCGDVIEHFEKKEGRELIDLCISKSKYLLINIPIGSNWQQDAVNGNEYERHRSVWNFNDFDKYKNIIVKKFRDIEFRNFITVLVSNERIDLKSAYGKFFDAKSIMSNKLPLKRLVELIMKAKKN